ncbi:hypothetical protein Agub_g10549 [Astrephomene gubernaculifera]|uniref:Uncharacterized protein n=1 Tax=Astrephomene gubernaculifera TaxID=47775 RepID=A0AAD3HPT6_9CHLO|nr:hypothetical protein Agub_g10549 [Astrephomene gubernaculifera]
MRLSVVPGRLLAMQPVQHHFRGDVRTSRQSQYASKLNPVPPLVAPRTRASSLLVTCSTDRRRSLIKRRSVPRAQRKKQRYRDDSHSADLDPSSPRFPGRLTSEINSASGPLQLAKLIQEYGLHFSGTQATMTLARLAAFATFLNLSEEQLAAQARATRRCVLLLRSKVYECDPLSYARGAYALGRLGVYDADLMALVVQETYDKLNLFAPEALAALVSGLGALGHVPPEEWLDRFALEAYTRFTRFNASELASLLYSLARLQHTPSTAWSERCLECFRATMLLPATPPLAPAMVKFAFGLASLQIRPSFNWAAAFVARLRPLLDSLSARELALLMWALPRLLGAAQPPQLPAAALAAGAAAARLPAGEVAAGLDQAPAGTPPGLPAATVPAQQASAVATAAAAPAVSLDREFLDAWFRCAARSMPNADASSQVLQLHALAWLQVSPLSAKYVVALLAQLQQAMPARTTRPGRVKAAPGLRQQVTEGSRTDSLTGAQMAAVLLSLVALRIRPGPDWMEAYMGALEPLLASLEPQALCDLAWALGQLEYQPSSEWIALFVDQCNMLSSGLNALQVQTLEWAFRKLHLESAGNLRELWTRGTMHGVD